MPFQKINTPDQNLQIVQDNVMRAVTVLDSAPLSGGVLLEGVSLISGQDNLVPHTLNRFPERYFAGIPNVDTRIWSPTTSALSGSNVSSTYINLRCSASCTVNIWVN